MKSLVIAEKPSVAADLARSLGKIPKKGDHYENDTHVISYALGHVVELEMPEDIDKNDATGCADTIGQVLDRPSCRRLRIEAPG